VQPSNLLPEIVTVGHLSAYIAPPPWVCDRVALNVERDTASVDDEAKIAPPCSADVCSNTPIVTLSVELSPA
jgi:hypothetical protein